MDRSAFIRALGLLGVLGLMCSLPSLAGAALTASAVPVEVPEIFGFPQAGMVALPPMLELLGAKSVTDGKTGAVTVSRAGKTFTFTLTKTAATANGKAVKLPLAPDKIGDVIYVPVRPLVETLGGTLVLDAATTLAKIILPGLAAPLILPFAKMTTQDPNGEQVPMQMTDFRDFQDHLFVMNIDGSGARRLTYTALANHLPSLSADGGKWVIVRSPLFMPFGDIYTREAVGAQSTRRLHSDLTDGTELFMDGILSPDGTTIYYTGIKDAGGENPDICIYRMPFAGGEAVKLVEGLSPAISADGKRLAYMGPDAEKMRALIFLAEADGANPRGLGEGQNPKISPDGKTLFFTRRYGEAEDAPEILTTCLIADNGDTRICEAPAEERAVSELQPAFTPDSKQILFVREGKGIFTMPVDRSQGKQLTDGANDANPVPSPEGAQIYFLRTGNLHRMNPDGTGITEITRDMTIGSFLLSPDGKLVYYLVQPEAMFG